MSLPELRFPTPFRWGTATSSYQVEGNLTNNDWFAAEQKGGFIYQNQRAGCACDWWNRAEEDFDRMVELNQNAHRLSIEWSRVEPEPGVWDEAALGRYREMIAGLRARGIEPMVTLHHFTNPLWVAEQGAWENEKIVGWFERYTRKVVSTLGDLVSLWCTINEPGVLVAQAYARGAFPPGKADIRTALHAGINVMRAHAAAYHAIHELQPDARVGLAKHIMIWSPWRSWQPGDQIATHLVDYVFNKLPLGLVTDGVVRIPGLRRVVLPETRHSLDWLGVNYYQRFRIRFSLLSGLSGGKLMQHLKRPGVLVGPGEWGEIHPDGLALTLRQLWRRYHLPLLVTENGIPDATDELRPGFIVSHLRQVWQAIKEGIPIWGYYFWSLVDNFEWTEGYDPRFRFGLIGVDFETQERHIRESGRLYGAISRVGGISREIVERFAPGLAPDVFAV